MLIITPMQTSFKIQYPNCVRSCVIGSLRNTMAYLVLYTFTKSRSAGTEGPFIKRHGRHRGVDLSGLTICLPALKLQVTYGLCFSRSYLNSIIKFNCPLELEDYKSQQFQPLCMQCLKCSLHYYVWDICCIPRPSA